MLKIGKKLCFPDVPSTWVPRTVELILFRQDCYRRSPNLKDPCGIVPAPPKNNDYEADESRSCNPFSLFPPTLTTPPIPIPTLTNRDDAHPFGPSHTGPRDAFLWSLNNSSNVFNFLMNDQLTDVYNPLQQGHTFDVISLLSTHSDGLPHYLVRNNGHKVPLDSLRGKHILLCCVFVPCFWRFSVSNALRGLFTFYEQQNHKAQANSDVPTEMVIVAKMRRNWGTPPDEDAFNHFFSGFPSSWLAVPFSHTLRRDHICNSIGLFQHLKCLLVDPDQKVVLHEDSYGGNGIHGFYCNNPSNMHLWWKTHTQLDFILNLDSHYVLNTANNNDMKVSISQLKEKLVALYLCLDGYFIQTLDIISRECKARNQQFEVVLVYLPYVDGVNPTLFQEAINHVLHNLNISNWWVSPFDDFVSRRLWEAVEFSEQDELVILDPHTNNADPFAKSVLHWFGINSYPFTREFLVLRELESLKKVTLESLLVYGSHDHVLRIDNVTNTVKEVPIAQLQGKIVILYVDQVEAPWPKVYPKLVDWYNRIKTTRFADDFEVLFVSCTPFDSPKLLSIPMPMPWLVCPFDLEHTNFVSSKTLHSDRYGYLLVFGKDGHIIKLFANCLLDTSEPDGFPPCSNDLCKDVIHHFAHQHDIDMTGVFDPLSYWF